MASSHRAAPFAMRRFISGEATVRHQNAPHPSGTIPGPRPSWPQTGILILAAPVTARSSARLLAELIIGGSLTSFEIIGTVREAR